MTRRSSSTVCEFSAFRTLGRLMVTSGDRAVAFEQQIVESHGGCIAGMGYINQPSTSADERRNPPNIMPPKRSCSLPVVLRDHREDQRRRRTRTHGQQERVALHDYFRPSATS